MHGIQIEVLEVHHVHLPNRHNIDFPAVQQLDPIGARQRRIDAAFSK